MHTYERRHDLGRLLAKLTDTVLCSNQIAITYNKIDLITAINTTELISCTRKTSNNEINLLTQSKTREKQSKHKHNDSVETKVEEEK